MLRYESPNIGIMTRTMCSILDRHWSGCVLNIDRQGCSHPNIGTMEIHALDLQDAPISGCLWQELRVMTPQDWEGPIAFMSHYQPLRSRSHQYLVLNCNHAWLVATTGSNDALVGELNWIRLRVQVKNDIRKKWSGRISNLARRQLSPSQLLRLLECRQAP
jgi:hypothetical protein